MQRRQVDSPTNLIVHDRRKPMGVTSNRSTGRGSLVGSRRGERRSSRRGAKAMASRRSGRASRTVRRERSGGRHRSKPRSKQRARRDRHRTGNGRSAKAQDAFEATRRLFILAATTADPAVRRPQGKAANRFEQLIETESVDASGCCRTRWRPEPPTAVDNPMLPRQSKSKDQTPYQETVNKTETEDR